MNFRRVTYSLAAKDGSLVTHRQEFFGSDGAASKRMTEIKTAHKEELEGKPERAPVDVPSTKAELLEWLNKNASVMFAEVPA